MRLKRLELYGYKSFASRCVFEFGEGVTAIVGPNGSGKSNIADAVRWVLGEQSYSMLRAKRTEDMIFAGARKRSRLGMAEVTLTLDNSDGWLPLDYTEVTITRRAYRSGENEYLLNSNRIRYRDLIDLLGSVGLIASAYTVIGQGMVDAALSLTPEARRTLFEEAAGIAPHLRKRQETLERIQETQRNLERVEDILNELRPRAHTLRRQAERAEEYLLLQQDLSELQRIWYGHQWQRTQQDLHQAEAHLATARDHLQAQHAYIHTLQSQQQAIRAQQEQHRQRIAALTKRFTELHDQAETLRREIAVSTERRHQLQQQSEQLARDYDALLSRKAILEKEIERTAQELAAQQKVYQQTAQALEQMHQESADHETRRQSLERQAREIEKQMAERDQALSRLQARAEQLMERRRDLTSEAQDLAQKKRIAQGHLQRLLEQTAQWEQKERATAARIQELEQLRIETEQRLTAARETLAALEAQASQIRAQREILMNRRANLARLREQFSDYPPGVRQILRSAKQIGGILGTVASLMQVPPAYERAIEAALGARLQYIITERWENAEACIALLKQTQAGWATFLPLDTLRPPRPMRPVQAPGVVGIAHTVITYDPKLEPVFSLLLGRTLIVEDLKTARRLLREHTGAALLVTLEGETVQPSGTLSGGAHRNNKPLLAQEREWRELPGQIRAVESSLAEILEEIAGQQGDLADLQELLRTQSSELGHLRLTLQEIHQEVMHHRDQTSQLERDLAWNQTRSQQIAQDLALLDDKERALHQEQMTLSQKGEELAAKLKALREQLAAMQDQGIRERLGELQTQAEVVARTAQSLERLLASHQANLNELLKQMEERTNQRQALTNRLTQVDQQLRSYQERFAELEKSLQEIQNTLEPEHRQLDDLAHQLERLAQQHEASLERLREAETAHNQALLERDRIRDRLARLADEIEEHLGPIDLPDPMAHQLRLNLGDDVVELPQITALPAGLEDEIRHLRTRLRRLGNVNPEAPREYEKLLERQTFLQSQLSDLRGAIASLQEVIEELDHVIERDFRSIIERVDKEFRQCFESLFGGGNARLLLTNPDDITSTGVDIIAQPPGKRAQRLSLLSGGERALTAVALLFALLKVNPVPFCFLDEVDAALDEANVGRFRDLLLENAKTTQFIVITHNRHTIEAATTIYGISMEEDGVSQSISLRVKEPSNHTTS